MAPFSFTRSGPIVWLASLLPLLLFVVLASLRAMHVDALVSAYTGCQHCLRGSVLHHDFGLLALQAALLGMALWPRWLVMRVIARLLALLLLLAWATDFAVFAALTQRLYVGDLLMFGTEGSALRDFIVALIRSSSRGYWLAAASLILVTAIATIWPRARSARQGVALLMLAALLAVAWWLPLAPVRYVHPEIYANVLEANFDNDVDTPYGKTYRDELESRPPVLAESCVPARTSTQPDVVVVLVESLSAYHSKLLGGDMDAVPHLDALARDNHYFTNFLANGFTTNGGRIALFTGRAPLPPPGFGRTLPLSAYAFRSGTLPDVARRAGYTSHYFTSGDLDFVDSKEWLEGLGFDSVEGSESPFYVGMRRWQFNAPEDHALFARLLDWIDQRNDARPFIAALLTVTTHPPFVNPRNGELNELDTFHYVDAQLAWLHEQLAMRGFFEHGVLLITGDHRSMTPLHPSEYTRWGETAFARIPLVVMGAVDMPKVVTQAFAQSDFPASFAALAGLGDCRDEAHGDFLRVDPVPASFLLHASGQQRNRVDVYFSNGQRRASYLLDGDNGTWQGETPPDRDKIQHAIDAQRMQEAVMARGD